MAETPSVVRRICCGPEGEFVERVEVLAGAYRGRHSSEKDEELQARFDAAGIPRSNISRDVIDGDCHYWRGWKWTRVDA